MKKIILTAIVAATLSSTVAFANTAVNTAPATGTTQVTGRGSFSISANFGFNSTSGDMTKRYDSTKASIGGIAIAYDYAMSKDFSIGAEIGFKYSAFMKTDNSYHSLDATLSSMPILATVHYRVPSVAGMDVFAKFGLSVNGVRTTYISKNNGYTLETTDNASGSQFVIGAGYNILPNLNIFGQYVLNSLQEDEMTGSKAGSMSTMAVGLSYRF